MAGRRERVDSASAAVRIMQGATRELQPPSHVRMGEEDWPFWHSVIAEFARSEWTEHQLELAAMLARSMADLEREQYELRKEGSVVFSEKGTPVANPRRAMVQMTSGTILAMRRSLSLHARAQTRDLSDIGKRRGLTKDVEAGLPVEDDMLGMGAVR